MRTLIGFSFVGFDRPYPCNPVAGKGRVVGAEIGFDLGGRRRTFRQRDAR
jgi:hypothetical protein